MLIRFSDCTSIETTGAIAEALRNAGHRVIQNERDRLVLALPEVDDVKAIRHLLPQTASLAGTGVAYSLVHRHFSNDFDFDLGKGFRFRSGDFLMIAGPCSVESEPQMEAVARSVAASGARLMRGGAYKPRTSPWTFQGLEHGGLRLLREAADRHQLLVVSEITDPRDLDAFYEYVDVIQIGTRSMMNYRLLKEVGRMGKPVVLKRGMSATVLEWLLSAEYLAAEGNLKIILCERGIRSFDPKTRNVLDLAAVPLIQNLSWLPVIVDPSHGTGQSGLVPPMAMAAVAAGANGLLIEVHPDPAQALSDGEQALNLEQFHALNLKITKLRSLI